MSDYIIDTGKPEQNQLIIAGETNPEQDVSELLIAKNVDVSWLLRAVIVSVWVFIPAQDVVMNLKVGLINTKQT